MQAPLRIDHSPAPLDAVDARGLVRRDIAAQLIVRLKRDNRALDELRDALEMNEAREASRELSPVTLRRPLPAAPLAIGPPVTPRP